MDNELSNPYLSFDVSYSSISDSFEDALLVEVSQDCGSTFTDTIYFKSGKFLSTDIQNNSTNSNNHTFRNESVSLKEFQGKKLGSLLLNYVIHSVFSNSIAKRLWVHTCSLDHKYALKNYISKGLKIFKKEEIDFEI